MAPPTSVSRSISARLKLLQTQLTLKYVLMVAPGTHCYQRFGVEAEGGGAWVEECELLKEQINRTGAKRKFRPFLEYWFLVDIDLLEARGKWPRISDFMGLLVPRSRVLFPRLTAFEHAMACSNMHIRT